MSQIYTVEQIANRLDMHPKTIRRYIREGNLSATKIGKQYRVNGDDLKRFLGIDIDAEAARPQLTQPHRPELSVSVSSSIDIKGVDGVLASTLTRNIMSASYGAHDTRVDCIYYENPKEFKVLVYGSIDYTEQMLKHVNLLISRLWPV